VKGKDVNCSRKGNPVRGTSRLFPPRGNRPRKESMEDRTASLEESTKVQNKPRIKNKTRSREGEHRRSLFLPVRRKKFSKEGQTP